MVSYNDLMSFVVDREGGKLTAAEVELLARDVIIYFGLEDSYCYDPAYQTIDAMEDAS